MSIFSCVTHNRQLSPPMALLSRDDLRYPSFLRRPLILGVLLLFVTAALLVFSPLPGSSRLSFTSSEEVVFDDMSKIPGQAVQAGRLAGWLESRKQLFLDDLRKGKLKGWTIAMGNEAGGQLLMSRHLRQLTVLQILILLPPRYHWPFSPTPFRRHEQSRSSSLLHL